MMNVIPILLLLLTVAVAVYPAHQSWGYVTGGGIGLLILFSWLTVMFNYE